MLLGHYLFCTKPKTESRGVSLLTAKLFSAFFEPVITLKKRTISLYIWNSFPFDVFPSWHKSKLFCVSTDLLMVCQGLKVEIFKNSSFFPGSTKCVCVLPKCRYSDGDLTLIYFGGDECSSGFQRMSVINFECNETAANGGKGAPVFTGEVDCTYFFTWDTKHACVKEKEALLCSVTDGKKRYDLSALARHSGRALWPTCVSAMYSWGTLLPLSPWICLEMLLLFSLSAGLPFPLSYIVIRIPRNDIESEGRISELEIGITVFYLWYFGLILSQFSKNCQCLLCARSCVLCD